MRPTWLGPSEWGGKVREMRSGDDSGRVLGRGDHCKGFGSYSDLAGNCRKALGEEWYDLTYVLIRFTLIALLWLDSEGVYMKAGIELED